MNYPRKVYAIRHNVTNRVYIGSSCRVDRRFHQHISDLRCHRHPVEDMQADFDQYGDDFTLTILDHISKRADNDREYDWMKKNQSYVRGVGYNYKDPKWHGVGREDNVVVSHEESKPSMELAYKKMGNLIETIREKANSDSEAAALTLAALSGFLCATAGINKED